MIQPGDIIRLQLTNIRPLTRCCSEFSELPDNASPTINVVADFSAQTALGYVTLRVTQGGISG